MTAKIDGTNGLLQQYDYQAPTTGFSYTFAAGTTVLILQPAGTLATGTVTMPAAPADGMTISFSSTQIITALTVSPNTGQSIIGNPTTILAGGAMTFVYRLSNTTWYAQVSTAAIGSAGAGAPVVTIYTSPSPWTKPAALKAVKVTVLAGGGGGSGSRSPLAANNGGGGGGGGIGFFSAPAIPGPLTITSGTGGAGGTAPSSPGVGNAGASGSAASFGPLMTATGGGGATTAAVGTAGTFTAIPQGLGFQGRDGGPFGNPAGSPSPQGGGDSFQGWGFGGLVSPVGVTGNPGRGYGAGGSGALSNSPGSALAGGAGSSGFVIVEEFY